MKSVVLAIPAIGTIDSYIASVKKIALLSHEEEIALASRHIESNDISAAHTLVMSHLRLVVTISRAYSGYGLSLADLIQEGNIGLMKAVKRFDPTLGVRLVSFATHWIRAEIHEFIVRNWRLVRIATTKAQRKLFFNLRSCKSTLESLTHAQAAQIAETLGVSMHEVLRMEQRFASPECSIDAPEDPSEEPNAASHDWLACEKYEPTACIADKKRGQMLTEGLANALAALDPRSQDIVKERWLADSGEEATLATLAKRYGVSAERIRQIEQQALKKMRPVLAAYA